MSGVQNNTDAMRVYRQQEAQRLADEEAARQRSLGFGLHLGDVNDGTQTYNPYEHGNPLDLLRGMGGVGGGGDISGVDLGAGSGGGGVAGMPVYAPPAPLSQIDRTAANEARFNSAKDKQGLITRASMGALKNVMASTGRLGSGVEGRGQAAIVNVGQQKLSDVNRQNTTADLASSEHIQDLNFAAANNNANTAYQGALTGRGQDLTARGQNLSAEASRRNSIIELAKMARAY